MSGLSLGIRLRSTPRPSPYIVETRRLLARYAALGAEASDERAAWLDEVVMRPLVSDGLLAKCDWLYLPGRAQDAAVQGVNLANPGTYDYTPNGVTFVADSHVAGNGANAWIATNFTVPASGGKVQQNSAHLAIRMKTEGAAQIIGQESGTQRFYLISTAAGGINTRLCGSTTAGILGGGGAGLTVAARAEAGTIRGYHDGALIGTAAAVSQNTVGQAMTLFRSVSTYSGGELEYASMGADLSDADIATLAGILDDAFAEAPPA